MCRELREIYTAPTVAAAEARFAEFAEQWRDRYPAMIATWERAWDEFVPFLDFPVEIRQSRSTRRMRLSTCAAGRCGCQWATVTS